MVIVSIALSQTRPIRTQAPLENIEKNYAEKEKNRRKNAQGIYQGGENHTTHNPRRVRQIDCLPR